MPVTPDDPKTLADSLYKQNIEISGKNKTLSLLSKLYEISILSLAPKEIALRVCETVLEQLSFELTGILLYNQGKDRFEPLAFAQSSRLKKAQSDSRTFFNEVAVSARDSAFLKQIIKSKNSGKTEKLQDIWNSLSAEKNFSEISSQGHLRSCIVYPLIIQESAIGILVLCFNRRFADLVDYEKESMDSFVNVIAVALDKALLDEQLKIANEQLKKLDQARADFISIASHQLRTPPATIKWYLAAVLGGDFGKISEKVRSGVLKAQSTNNSMISLIDDMLNASRIERGKMEFLFEQIDITKLAEMTVDQLMPQALDKKLKLVFVKPKKKIPLITADKEKIRQVINNFIDNAIKYTKQGSIKAEFELSAKDVVFKVTDTGKGVKADEISKVFEKYNRGSNSVTHATGLGLGLYVAKVIVDQHKGRAWAESKGEGLGSTFCFSLPLKAVVASTSSFDLIEKKVKA